MRHVRLILLTWQAFAQVTWCLTNVAHVPSSSFSAVFEQKGYEVQGVDAILR